MAFGRRADCCSPQNYTIALEAGSNVVASTNGSTGSITAGTFATVTVTFATGGTPPSGNIGIALTSAGTQVDFDNVQLGMSGTVPDNSIYFYVEDMLGSSRTMVADGQTSLCFDADFLPFGYEKDVTTTCAQNYKFESKERDTETNNDDFGARYFSNRLGRWLSADWSSVPAPVPYANLTNPQTLNLYAMVSDNPESFADLTGHECTIGPGGSDACKADPAEPENGPSTTGEGAGNNPNNGMGTDPSPTQQTQQPTQQNQPANDQTKTDQQKKDDQQNQSSAAGGNRTPSSGPPNTTERVPGASPGSYGERTYGPDGRAKLDIDHGHDHGQGDPHAHDWDWSKTPARQPGRALTPGERAGADLHRFSGWVSDHKGAIITTVAVVGAAAIIVASGGTAAPVVALAF